MGNADFKDDDVASEDGAIVSRDHDGGDHDDDDDVVSDNLKEVDSKVNTADEEDVSENDIGGDTEENDGDLDDLEV